MPNNTNGRRKFSCITHSTGGPVVRTWIENYYGASGLSRLPLQHLVMLAPANHGAALAQLGKSRLGRIRAWFQGVEPGQRILDWLELGSVGQWELNHKWLAYEAAANRFFPFVLSGDEIDPKLYDHLNSYTGEKGSDGVIRLAAANLNYQTIRLRQSDVVLRKRPLTLRLELADKGLTRASEKPFGIIPQTNHCGKKMGIMDSVTLANAANKPVVSEILKCLRVASPQEYSLRAQEMAKLTKRSQSDDPCAMVVFHVHDEDNKPINDFDMLLLAGRRYDPNKLPDDFFIDRQRNSVDRSRLTYYLNWEKVRKTPNGCIGIRITARPSSGFVYYTAGEFRSEQAGVSIEEILRPNETLYVDIEMRRNVDMRTVELDPLSGGRRDFKRLKPSHQSTR